jgi:hypothetical protein
MNHARKSVNWSISNVEGVVSNAIDEPFSFYQEKLEKIEMVNPAQRYTLIQRIGTVNQNVKNGYGDNTKWKWAFVELDGRYAAITKNIMDLRGFFSNSDPRSPYYEPTVYHLNLIKKLLERAADSYRKKYELFSNEFDDFRKSISFLSALKQMYIFTGDQENAVSVKKKIEVWTNKLTADMARKKKLNK